ncbi:MAG: hypothetical protein ABR880_14225 [Candidatus Sulfotelmatobacter sp.]|jgi:hypothetical protein
MSIFRLLPFSLLIAMSAAPVAAQTSPEKAPFVIQYSDSGISNIRIGKDSPQSTQFGVPKVWLTGPDGQLLDDTYCYSMRSYKVARDNPDSDSTHAVGYSTCQPAARFRTHTIKGVILPEQP